jgi:hypothetical protein
MKDEASVLRALPCVDARPREQTLSLDGSLLAIDSNTVRLVVGPVCVTLFVNDIIGITELPSGTAVEMVDSFAVPIRIELSAGAGILNVSSCEAYRGLLSSQRRPFAIESRRLAITRLISPLYRDRQSEFLKKRGLI